VWRSFSAILVLGGGMLATEFIPIPPLPELAEESYSKLVVNYIPFVYPSFTGFYTTIILFDGYCLVSSKMPLGCLIIILLL